MYSCFRLLLAGWLYMKYMAAMLLCKLRINLLRRQDKRASPRTLNSCAWYVKTNVGPVTKFLFLSRRLASKNESERAETEAHAKAFILSEEKKTEALLINKYQLPEVWMARSPIADSLFMNPSSLFPFVVISF